MLREERRANSVRTSAEREALDELDQWRRRAMADPAAPLDAEDLVRLMQDCLAALGLDPDIAAECTVSTVHYYRRKEIIDPPHGRTAAARYDQRHLWQVIGARLAGALGLVTLAEARNAFRDASERELRAFVAARVVDTRARSALRSPARVASAPRERIRPLSKVEASPASMISLPGGAICILPESHNARHSHAAARELVRALARALNVSDTP